MSSPSWSSAYIIPEHLLGLINKIISYSFIKNRGYDRWGHGGDTNLTVLTSLENETKYQIKRLDLTL